MPWDASWLAAAGQDAGSPFSMAVYVSTAGGPVVGAGAVTDSGGLVGLQDGTHRGSVDVFSDSTLSTQGSPGPDAIYTQGDFMGY